MLAKNNGAISTAYGYGLEPVIHGPTAVNLAAFTSVLGSLVAAGSRLLQSE
jgi:hypothetical protein